MRTVTHTPCEVRTWCDTVLTVQEPKRGQGTSAVFIARNRFAVLDKGSNQIVIKNLNNEITKKAPSPCATTDAIFYAGTGTLLCRSEDKVCYYSLPQRCFSQAPLEQHVQLHVGLYLSSVSFNSLQMVQCSAQNAALVSVQRLLCMSEAALLGPAPRNPAAVTGCLAVLALEAEVCGAGSDV